jgi:hypothetical protein
MLALHTTYRRNHLNAKDALRVHVDQLPPDKQVEFASVALQLLAERSAYQEPEVDPRFRQFLRAAMD